METQDFRNFKFRLVFLEVLRNAVLLSYRALESVHGARRTKQEKNQNFHLHERQQQLVEARNLHLLRSPSSVNRFQSTVAQKNGVEEYFQKN